uniref:Blue copper protein n=1 Tax=Anthurium amnicola TaxID=1678845 RepID=A0A1D1YM47_9ARAE
MSALRTLAALCVALCAVVPAGAATLYNVGDTAGWDISADLDKWPVGKNFTVGDTLWFQYSRYHTVNEVDKRGFYNCSTANATETGAGGNTTITLTTPGDKYFICGVLSHCFGGMRLHFAVIGTPGGWGLPLPRPHPAPPSPPVVVTSP